MNAFTHIHSSGRFDRSAASVTAAENRYVKDADFITHTEFDFPARKQAMAAVDKAHGFGTIFGTEGHANDAAISYKKDRFKLVYKENFKNSDIVVHRTDGHARDLPYTTIAVFDDLKSGKRFVVGVSHYASNVEAQVRDQHTTYGRVLQWRQSTRRSKNRVNHIAKKFHCDARLVIGDWNINFKRVWAKALVKAMAPSYMNTWKNTNVAGGTHGNRIIDATLVRGKLGVRKTAKLYTDDASSDHRPYIETLVWL